MEGYGLTAITRCEFYLLMSFKRLSCLAWFQTSEVWNQAWRMFQISLVLCLLLMRSPPVEISTYRNRKWNRHAFDRCEKSTTPCNRYHNFCVDWKLRRGMDRANTNTMSDWILKWKQNRNSVWYSDYAASASPFTFGWLSWLQFSPTTQDYFPWIPDNSNVKVGICAFWHESDLATRINKNLL